MPEQQEKREWRGPLGWGLLFLGVIERVVGWGGSIDFVLSRTNDPGWVGKLFAFFLTNIGLALILAGVGFIVWNERRRTERLLEARLGGQGAPIPERHIDAAGPLVEPTAQPEPTEDRILLGSNITPTFLIAQHENKTSLEGAGITDRYLGKWMRLTAYLDNASMISSDWLAVSLQYPRTITLIPGHDIESPVDIYAHFKTDLERLKVRRRGDVLTIEGRLERVSISGIELADCRLLKARTKGELKAAVQKRQSPQDTGPETPQ